MSFTDREVAHENTMADLGRDRRRASTARTRALGRESLTPAGHGLVRASMVRTVEAAEAWLKDAGKRRVVNRPEVYALIAGVPVKVLCLLALRVSLDGATRQDSWQACVHAIASRLDEERMARWLSSGHSGLWATIRRRAAAVPQRAASRLRKAAAKLGREKAFPKWTARQRILIGAWAIGLVERHAGLLSVESVPCGRRKRLMLRVMPEVSEWIASADQKDQLLEPLYMPMLDEPGEWAPGRGGGYSTGMVARRHLVKNKSRATRELVAGAVMPDVYSAVNALQSTAWEINPDVLEVARTLFAAGEAVAGLEKAADDPFPPRPSDGPTAEWMRQRFVIRRNNLQRSGRRVEAARVLWLANKMQPEGAFYFPQQLDFRGRVYPIPQFLQPQGPDLARGVLRFAKGDWIDRQCAAFWVHGANCYGLDKLPMAERWSRIMALETSIRAVHADPLSNLWWQEAEEPWQFLAWCLEAGQLLETGRVLTRVPCYVDGTNNGLQILSLLLRDPVGGAATNCTPGERRDVYQDVADEVTRRLKDTDDDTARGWLSWFPNGRMPRAAAKRSVMTLPYGCTPWSSRQYLVDWFEEELRQGRENPWGRAPHWERSAALAGTLWAAIEALLGPALRAMAWLREVASTSVGAGMGPVWTAPSGFTVRQSYTNWEVQQIRTKFGERVRWVRSRKAGDRLNLRRHVNALPPNFVHSLDASVLAQTVARFVRAGHAPVSTIHDSFGTTAARIGDLGRIVREVYAETFEADQLQIFLEQICNQNGGRIQFPQPPERGALDPRGVLGSTYLFS